MARVHLQCTIQLSAAKVRKRLVSERFAPERLSRLVLLLGLGLYLGRLTYIIGLYAGEAYIGQVMFSRESPAVV